MTYLVERLSELRRHLDHLYEIRPRVAGRQDLERDLSLHNDVLFSLLTVCQLVIDVAGDLAAFGSSKTRASHVPRLAGRADVVRPSPGLT